MFQSNQSSARSPARPPATVSTEEAEDDSGAEQDVIILAFDNEGNMKWVAIIVLSIVTVAILLFICLCFSLRGAGPSVKYSGFTDERFLLLLFPVGEDIPLGRAVIVSLFEYKQEFIEVYVDGAAVTVSRSSFTPIPPQDYAAWVERLNRELTAWGKETDWSNIEYAFTPSEQGGKAVMTITNKKGTKHGYTYILDGPSIRPIEVKTNVNAAKNLSR